MTALQDFLNKRKEQQALIDAERRQPRPDRKVQVATFQSNIFTSVSGTAVDQNINYTPNDTNTPVNTYDTMSTNGTNLEFTSPFSRFYDYTTRVYLSELLDPSDLTDENTNIEAQLAADFLVKVYKVDINGVETLLTTGRSTTDGAALVTYPGLTEASRIDNLQASDFTGVVYLETGEKLRMKLDYNMLNYIERITSFGVSLRPFYSGLTGYIGSSTIYPFRTQEVQNTSAANKDVFEDPDGPNTTTPRTFPVGGAFPSYTSGSDTDHLLFVQNHVLSIAGDEGFTGTPTVNTFTGNFDFFMRITEIGVDY